MTESVPHDDEQDLVALRAANQDLRRQLAEREQEAHDLRVLSEEQQAKLVALEHRLERMGRRIFGSSSERHHPGQQVLDLGQTPIAALVEAAPVATEAALTPGNADDASAPSAAAPPAATTSEATPMPAPAKAKAKVAPRHPGRHRAPASAEVVETDLEVPEAERLDASGAPLPLLGWKTSEKWDYRPGTYLIRRYRRAIYGRPFSDAEDRVVAAPAPALIPQGSMTDAALIHTVVEKFADHLPLYRQSDRAGRQGFTVRRSTLADHVTAVARAMAPIVAALADTVRAAPYIHLDDTPVRLLDPGRGTTATARIWVYRSCAATVFRFTTTREGRHPGEFLGHYRGHLVADAYAGHEHLYGIDGATHVACWAHVRRKFSDLKHRVPFALRMVEEIQVLYQIERDLAAAGPLTDVERLRIRHERSAPQLARIKAALDHAAIGCLPKSDLGIAILYALKRWAQLTEYLAHGHLPIDNNPAENALRPWAIGRKNWLFLGSPAGGERAAIIATIIENCRRQHLDPAKYLRDVVALLHAGRTDYANLTPQALATQIATKAA